MKVSLLGNVILDRVFLYPRNLFRAGGIVNVARALRLCDEDLEIHVRSAVGVDDAGKRIVEELSSLKCVSNLEYNNSDRTSTCGIFAEKNGERKDCQLSMGACQNTDYLPIVADWTHLAYPNLISQAFNGKMFDTDKTSIDFSSVLKEEDRTYYLFLLGQFDYVFLNETEAKWMTNQENVLKAVQSISRIVKKSAIVHSNRTNYLVSKGEYVEIPVEKRNDVLVLGAGDYLAAGFILHKLSGADDTTAVVHATEFATEAIKTLNDY